MANQEERGNYFSLTLLLFRVGNQKLREYFKTQWPIVYQRVRPGTVPPPWNDTPHDAIEMEKIQPSKLKFKFKDEETKFNSGNTNDWDFSLLTSVLRYSSLQFVLPSSPESKALDDLKKIRNRLIGHATDAAIPNTLFHTAWTDACNALALFNASDADFKCVQDDVNKPWNVLYPMLKQCVEQEKEIKDSVDTIINRIVKLQQTVEQQHTTLQQTVEQQHTTLQRVEVQHITLQQTLEQQHTTLQQTVEQQHTTLQQTVEQQHTTLQQTVEQQHTTLQQTVENQYTTLQQTMEEYHETQLEATRNIVDQVLSQGQQGQKRSSADVQPEEDVKTKKPRTTSDDRERDHAKDSEMLKEAIKGNTEYQTKIMAAHDVTSAKTDEIFTNLTVYYADKKQEKKEQAKDLGRSELLQEYTKRTGRKVEKYEDIFIDMKGKNPKLLLTGKPGIGKTMFCDKIIRDWSMNTLFLNEDTPDIQFAYLLKFRHLDGDKEINLHELLNCSPFLDDNSKIKDSLFEYLIQNPSKVLIILDGFDECSEEHRKQISGDFEKKYPNDSKKEMPIPALCSKLIKGIFFKNSVVLVSSRPGKAEELGKIKFDRYVKILGFSPEQVIEYVDKYFSEPEEEQTKKAVREHVEKNENLISFCHIPLLSFLLCWCLEWRISRSEITAENLPAKITDLYDEVAKVLIEKLHAKLKNSEEQSKNLMMEVVKETLVKLEKLGANLLKESKYIFDEEDMKKLDLTEDEIENLKVSGILHCVPGIRITAFQTKAEFSFTHLTLHEYLSASFFVKNNEIPENVSGQTFVFMCGLLSRKKNGEQLMNKLIKQITPEDNDDDVNKLLMLQCLYEYGEKELTTRTINNLYDQYCDSDGVINLDVTDVGVKYLSYLLDIIRSLKEQHPQSSSDYTLNISSSALTSFGVGVVCRSLVRNSFITKLELSECSLDDKCVEKITDSLVNTGITHLNLEDNKITCKGVKSICSVLKATKITHLNLEGNNITNEGVKSICSVLTDTKIVHLDLTGNKITEEGVKSICSVLKATKITHLNLGVNKIKDEGVKSICSVLTKTKITHINLKGNEITDEGVKSICSVLTDTKLTYLNLGWNNITDEGVKSICSVLIQTKITDLNLGNNITDEGAESICRLIIQDNCQIEGLWLGGCEKMTAECNKRLEQLVEKHKPGNRLGLNIFR